MTNDFTIDMYHEELIVDMRVLFYYCTVVVVNLIT